MRPRRARLPAVLLVTLMLTSLVAACRGGDGAAVRIESLSRGGPNAGRRGDAKDAIRIAAPPGLHEGIEQAIEYGITGVPAFVIDGRWSIPGAQDTDTFVNVFRQLKDRIVVESAPVCEDDICDV